jgi:hypothetical protein
LELVLGEEHEESDHGEAEELQSTESDGFLEALCNTGWMERPESPEQEYGDESEEAEGPKQKESELEQRELEEVTAWVEDFGWLDGEDVQGALTYASGNKDENEEVADRHGSSEPEEDGLEGRAWPFAKRDGLGALLGRVRGKACRRARAHARNLDVVGLGQHVRNLDVVYHRAGKRFGNTSWLIVPATSFMYGAAWQKGVVCDRSTLCL